VEYRKNFFVWVDCSFDEILISFLYLFSIPQRHP
jgi:hypothetical protein